jgi:hypothetical protein
MKGKAKNESNIVIDQRGFNFCGRLCCLYHSGGWGGRSGGCWRAPGADRRRRASQPGCGIRLDWRGLGLAGALGLGSGALGPPAAPRSGLGATPIRWTQWKAHFRSWGMEMSERPQGGDTGVSVHDTGRWVGKVLLTLATLRHAKTSAKVFQKSSDYQVVVSSWQKTQ